MCVLADFRGLEGSSEYSDSLQSERQLILLQNLLQSRQRVMNDLLNVNPGRIRVEAEKRGPGMCINNCLTGGMTFVRCKSMCHW